MIVRTFLLGLLLLSPLHAAKAPEAPTSRPTNLDPAVWDRMLAIDAKAGQIHDLVANFEQQKFTAMLKKPLVSTGQVFVRGSSMLWDTARPEQTVLQLTDREARIYYPAQKTIEVYQVREKLSELAASPVPRLAVLEQYFAFEPIPVTDLGEQDTDHFFAVRMTPTEPELRRNIDQVRVLLDARRGLIVRLEMRDTDGDRTVISFSNVRTNLGLKDAQLRIDAPADVKITHPLAAIEDTPAKGESSPASRGN